MPKILAAVSTLVIATLVFFGWSSFQDKSKIQELEKSPDRGKLSWHAQMAKAKGERSIVLRASIPDYAVPRSLDDALANYHFVVAEPVGSQSVATTYNIQTWYKFRLIEELSAPGTSCVDCLSSISPPEALLPLAPNEFLSSKTGGQATVEDVQITSSDPEFPNFEIGKRYFLLVAFDSNRIVGALRTGPWGAFVLNSNDRLEPIEARHKHPLREQLTEKFGNFLPNLRHGLKTKK